VYLDSLAIPFESSFPEQVCVYIFWGGVGVCDKCQILSGVTLKNYSFVSPTRLHCSLSLSSLLK
jgi:hypothetical protein